MTLCGCGQFSPILQPGECKLCWAEQYQPEVIAKFSAAGLRNALRPDLFPLVAREMRPVSDNPDGTAYVGMIFQELLASLGIVMQGKCGCDATMARMNSGGPTWCRDNLTTLAAEIAANATQYGWYAAFRSLDIAKIRGNPDAAKVAARIIRHTFSLTPILSAIAEAVVIACERAEAPQPEPRPPQPNVEQLPTNPHSDIKPHRRWRIDPTKLATSEYHFNSSLIEWRGRKLLAYRRHWYQALIHIAELDRETGQPINDIEVDIPRSSGNAIAVEDPRFFVHDGSLWLEVIGVAKSGDGKAHTNIQLVRLDSETLQPVESYFPKYEPRREWEKNWGMFSYGEKLHAIYTIAPNHIVLSADLKTPGFSRIDSRPFAWPRELGHPRGGASPYLWRNEWYHFVHCVMRFEGQRWYSINLYTFENAPPFRPARILPFPLLLPDVADRWNDSHPNVVFPAGVVRRGGYWQVSYGYQDKWTEIAEWDGDALELLLEPVPGGPYDLALRPGWHDRTVWRDVYVGNAYELPERFSPDDTIVDVGAHVGSFSRACLDRGAGRVIACEPHFGAEWRANLESYGDRARLVEQAIGSERARSCIQPYRDGLYDSTPTREYFGSSIPLSEVLEGLGPVRLLKLDCEGPEFSILAETDLSQVQEVIGEIHPHRYAGEEFSYEGFLGLLRAAGFTVTKAVRPGETGLFWATASTPGAIP